MSHNPYDCLEGESFIVRETCHVLNSGRLVTVKCNFIGNKHPLTVQVMVYDGSEVIGYWSTMSAIVTALNKGKKQVIITYPVGHREKTTKVFDKQKGMYLLTNKRKSGDKYYSSYSLDETWITENEWEWIVKVMHAHMDEYSEMFKDMKGILNKDFDGLWF